MRPLPIGALMASAALAAACAHSPAPPPAGSTAKSTPVRSAIVDPSRIKRVVGELPPGYEVNTAIPAAASPPVIWGLPAGAAAVEVTPPECAALADPGNGRDHGAQGVSASGTGGIVDAVVVALPEPAHLDQHLTAACGAWSMSAGHTVARVRLTGAPHVDDAETVGMVTETRSSVESGTQIDAKTYTFVAYLGNYYAFTTLTTDPGSAVPSLPPQFAADLLVKTVSTLRG